MTAMKTMPPEKNDTFIECGGDDGRTFVEGPSARPEPKGGDLSVNGETRLGGSVYRVLKQFEVASGESDVYLVEKTSPEGLNEKFVLKLFRFGFKPKLEVSALLGSVGEGAVVRIFDSGASEGGRFYEIQEFAPHGSLRGLMRPGCPMPPAFVRQFVSGLNGRLRAIHSKNIIHRDIKPDNILVRRTEPLELVLADFGISSVAELQLHQTSINRTILYSSPESMTGVISRAVDYWAMGIIALEMLTGTHPFAGVDERAAMYWLATRPVDGIGAAGAEFERLLKGLLTRDPNRRWGFEEVDAFCRGAGDDIAVYFERDAEAAPAVSARKCRPYNFAGTEHRALDSLVGAMAANWRVAVDELSSRRLRDWVARELRDQDALFLLEDLASDDSMTRDEKLLEFCCRTVEEFPFIFLGFHLRPETLAAVAVKVVRGEASDDEVTLIKSLAGGGVVERYAGISGRQDSCEALRAMVAETACAPNDPVVIAKMILINHSAEYRERLVDRIRRAMSESFVAGPLRDASGRELSPGQAAELIDSVINGRERSAAGILSAAEAPRGCLMPRRLLDEKFAAFKAAFSSISGLAPAPELRDGLERAAVRRFKGSQRPREPFYEFAVRIASAKVEYSMAFYETVALASDVVDAFKARLKLLNSPEITVDLGEGVGIEMLRIPAGSFVMGSDEGYEDEAPAHGVTITRPFFMGRFPVTQRQWEKVMGSNPSYFKRGGDYPVEKVSWNDCAEFVKKLNALGLIDAEFRLPTEAEWEFAARAGSKGRYHWGEGPEESEKYCWHRGNSNHETHPCGRKLPNAFGLFDTAGNVREWCLDWYAPYPAGEAVDPRGPESGSLRAGRGGDWKYDAADCTVSGRDCIEPAFRDSNLGFRLAME